MVQRGKKKADLRNFLDEESSLGKTSEKFKKELKEEIKEELKRELRGEGLNIEFIDGESEKREEAKKIRKEKLDPEKKRKRRYVRVLVILVAIILILDLFSLYFYYKSNLNLNFFSSIKSKIGSGYSDLSSKKCSDGTLYEQCSKDKPYYCYNGELLKKAYTCGCPSGYKVAFQDCRKI